MYYNGESILVCYFVFLSQEVEEDEMVVFSLFLFFNLFWFIQGSVFWFYSRFCFLVKYFYNIEMVGMEVCFIGDLKFNLIDSEY